MFKSVAAMELSCDITGHTDRQTDRQTQPFIVKDNLMNLSLFLMSMFLTISLEAAAAFISAKARLS